MLRVRLIGAPPVVKMEALDMLPGRSHYYSGSDPSRWHFDIPQYGSVFYREIYPGIDVRYHGNQQKLEYDFVVGPGADPGRIRLEFEGHRGLSLSPNGDLIIKTAGGDIRQAKPLVYQERDGARQVVSSAYELFRPSHRSKQEVVGFRIQSYDAHRPLIIDPVLFGYSTFLGGSGQDIGYSIAVDSTGAAYIAGKTASTNFPMQTPLQPSNSGGLTDAFVTKLNSEGTALVYSTYLGGSGDDIGSGIAIDSVGAAYVTGETTSINFPTQNAFQGALAGYNDAFVTKLNPTGTLAYSTYLGGTIADRGLDVAVDGFGSAYVSGATNSWLDFPLKNPVQPKIGGGGMEGFISKLNPEGSALVYSTYQGGNGADTGRRIAIDGSGAAYITGDTNLGSPTLFPTKNPLQGTYGGGSSDAFVSKVYAFEFSTVLEFQEVRPNQGLNNTPNEITLVGGGFIEGATLALIGTTRTALGTDHESGRQPSKAPSFLPMTMNADTLLPTYFVSATELRATVPSGLTPGTYAMSVTNPDTQKATLSAAYTVLDSQNTSLDDLYGNSFELWTLPATPRIGSVVELGLILHRNGGVNAISNIVINFLQGDCSTGTLLGTGSVNLQSPNSSTSSTSVSWTPSAMGAVGLCAIIDPGNLIPESREDNNRVIRMVNVMEALADLIAPHVDSFTLQNGASSTAAQDIKLGAIVSDPVPSSGIASLFYQEFEFHQGVKSWIPVKQSGWLPYANVSVNYNWKLVPFSGLHLLQAWAMDKAGNVSVYPYKGAINYGPSSDSIGQRQKRIYRQTVNLGQTLSAKLIPVSGDPDLYVWAPDSETRPPWVSNLSSGMDEVTFMAPVAGVYQVEVHGITAAQYQLTISVTDTNLPPVDATNPGKVTPSSPVILPTNEPNPKTAAPGGAFWFIRLPLILR